MLAPSCCASWRRERLSQVWCGWGCQWSFCRLGARPRVADARNSPAPQPHSQHRRHQVTLSRRQPGLLEPREQNVVSSDFFLVGGGHTITVVAGGLWQVAHHSPASLPAVVVAGGARCGSRGVCDRWARVWEERPKEAAWGGSVFSSCYFALQYYIYHRPLNYCTVNSRLFYWGIRARRP